MVKVLVSFDDTLLKRIDAQARRRGLTRSAYLSELAREQLGDGARPASTAIDAVRRAREACSVAAKPADATVLVRQMRDDR